MVGEKQPRPGNAGVSIEQDFPEGYADEAREVSSCNSGLSVDIIPVLGTICARCREQK